MLLAGPSKAGKSYALIELAVAIGEGKTWLGFQCAQGRVLYINLEIDPASVMHRFADVYKALGWPTENIDNIDIWNLRGRSLPLNQLAPKLIRRAQKKAYSAIIFDPIYKIITGDENSADQMAAFCNQFDRVCADLGASVIYCHHHSKGSQGQKRSMDRASGSGVFARDPDTLLDYIELNPSREKILEILPDYTGKRDKLPSAYRIEGTMREFAPFTPVNCLFQYPIHIYDEDGVLENEKPLTDMKPFEKGTIQNKENAVHRHAQKQMDLQNALDRLEENEIPATINTVAEAMEIHENTLRRWLNGDLKEYFYLDKNNGFVKEKIQ
jgi:hypothetical protein